MFAMLAGRAGHYLLLLLACGLLFFANLGGPSLWDVDEGRNATAALEMHEADDWVVPTFNAELRADKPALLYWCQIVCYRLFGIHETSARLPSALAALLTMLVCYELGRRLFSPTAGLFAGLIAASTPMLCAAARFANPDSLLNLFSVALLALFWAVLPQPLPSPLGGRGAEGTARWWFWALGALAGLASLAKGPVGFLLPGAVIFTYLMWERRLALLWQRGVVESILVLGAVSLPWYAWVAFDTHGEFLRGFFLRHNVSRFLSPMENHGGFPLFYVVVLLAGLAPWCVFLGWAFWYGGWSCATTVRPKWQTRWLATVDAGKACAYRFLLTWIGVYLLFFSFAATKLPNYVLPAVVPCALLIGRSLERWQLGQIKPAAWVVRAALLTLVGIGLATGIGLAIAAGLIPLESLRSRAVFGLAPWAGLGIVPCVSALIAWRYWRRSQCAHANVALLTGAVLFLGPLAAWAMVAWNDVKAVRPLVAGADGIHKTRDIRIGALKMEHLPSLNFYVQRTVSHHAEPSDAAAFLRYPLPVYLFLPATEWEELSKQTPSCRVLGLRRDMYRNGEVVLVTNVTEGLWVRQ